MGTLIPLDDYAREQLATYIEAGKHCNDAKQIRDKAREALIDFFDAHDADVGTIDDKPVIRLLRFDKPRFDVASYTEDHPFESQRYITITRVTQIRQASESW